MGALFTGRTPAVEAGDGPAQPWTSQTWCGLARFASPGEERCVPGALETLAESLSGLGYETLGVTSNLLLYEPAGFARGLDVWEEAAHPATRP